MDEFLTKLRNKPDAQKRRIVLFSSLGITLLVAVFWLVSLRVTNEWGSDQGTEAAVASSSTSPFATFEAGLQGIGAGIGEMTSEVQGLFGSTTK